jgi:hypothetical protein
MREFFIKSLDILINVVVVLMFIGVVVAAGAAFVGGQTPSGQPMGGGPIAGLAILVLGTIYIMFVAGFMYLGLGIYHNTKRSAEALEKLASK